MKFSYIEKQHLLKAWVAISLAFAVLMGNIISLEFIIYFVISLVTVGLGFLLHELAHKYVAQKYGCWAEFRADDRMLIFAILGALFFGFVFAAPGAVFIHGNVTKKKNGIISIAGPITNMILAIAFFIPVFFYSVTGIVGITLILGYRINALIGLFNMIPFMNFDGAKIIKWSKPIYIATVIVSFMIYLPVVLGYV